MASRRFSPSSLWPPLDDERPHSMRQHRFHPGAGSGLSLASCRSRSLFHTKTVLADDVREQKKTAIVPSPSNVLANSPASSVSIAHPIACVDRRYHRK
ncbi:hypothetical protein P4518_11280 [Geobacillus thermodenitrificans]|uniref:hypothetical protein n=1 Tax=Geobacillus TaxID=129337 RepID=UPI0012FCD173|nr:MULTISPECIES: hypothetical protein [Geobacillus]MEC5187735.1 hypothetical protein [Geobacillus thermodenitrificans]MED3717943.1 hypothetical protein [Geobacillus thermodenitrificans]